ncbi:hypothetical protein SAMN05216529_1238 [Faecalicatena contorta]|uniref:Uncharacterized protein n=1 Tax=Faecalicatena contorta TaxID=39482 RepID=A0A316AB63_9FIRM|nr:hypothetical protein A8805_1238 [Faecalicatena contorta]SUQ16168.1 hypothetical protein SAMN05216529_1238 [Faecalicatena contorta]
MASTGEKPGKGQYVCITYGQVTILDDNTEYFE